MANFDTIPHRKHSDLPQSVEVNGLHHVDMFKLARHSGGVVIAHIGDLRADGSVYTGNFLTGRYHRLDEPIVALISPDDIKEEILPWARAVVDNGEEADHNMIFATSRLTDLESLQSENRRIVSDPNSVGAKIMSDIAHEMGGIERVREDSTLAKKLKDATAERITEITEIDADALAAEIITLKTEAAATEGLRRAIEALRHGEAPDDHTEGSRLAADRIGFEKLPTGLVTVARVGDKIALGSNNPRASQFGVPLTTSGLQDLATQLECSLRPRRSVWG